MRFANPPGLASFMAKNAGYDQIGSQGIKESAETDLTTMGTMGQAQANALNTIAKDKAAEYMRDAQAFGMAQKADAQLFGSIAGAVGTIGGSAIKKFGSNPGTNPLPGSENTNDFSIGDALDFDMDVDKAEHIAGGGFVETVFDGDTVGESIFKSY